MSSRIVGRRLVVDGGPLVGAAAVRELTSPDREWTKDAHGIVGAGLTADVENDGDRGPRPIDQAADAARAKVVRELLLGVGKLSVDEVAALAWIARELPGARLRRRCEEATATGWCRTEDPSPTARSTPEDRTRAALLAAWRQVVALVHGARSSASEDLRQRPREDVLADEAARRAGGAK